MGYHKVKIERGVIGEFSKIKEEYSELHDGYVQGDKILQLCELSDLIGAIEAYTIKNFGITIDDLKKVFRQNKVSI